MGLGRVPKVLNAGTHIKTLLVHVTTPMLHMRFQKHPH